MTLTSLQIANLERLHTALLSGQYKQAVGSLREKDCFCVMGVACDISNQGEWDDADVYKSYKMPNNDNCEGYLDSLQLQNMYGFDHEEGWNDLYIASLNDARESFTELAAKIRMYIDTHRKVN